MGYIKKYMHNNYSILINPRDYPNSSLKVYAQLNVGECCVILVKQIMIRQLFGSHNTKCKLLPKSK